VPASNHPALLVLGAADGAAMRSCLADLAAELAARAAEIGMAELAGQLQRELPAEPQVRCAIVAATVAEAGDAVEEAAGLLGRDGLSFGLRAFLGSGAARRIGLLFPGQGAPATTAAGGLGERLPEAAGAFSRAGLDQLEEVPDELVQLSVVASSLAGIEALRALGVEAELALGHSLGELTARHWAGAIDEPTLLRIARARGAAMTSHAAARGTMAAVQGERGEIEALVEGTGLTIACQNSPRQWVVSGEVEAVQGLLERAKAQRLRATRLKVVGAFHSPLMQPALAVFRRSLAAERFDPLRQRVVSSVSGAELGEDCDLRDLLLRQIVDPVRFAEAAATAARQVGLLIEVGPGRILTPMLREASEVPVVATRVGAGSSRPLVETAAALFAAGLPAPAEALAPPFAAEVRV
jgi:enediyne polyketide synthase